MVVMVTGGARSGKSAFAEKLCRETGERAGYIATAVITDGDMRARVEAHRAQRPQEWATFERYADFAALESEPEFDGCGIFLLDCVTTMIANHMMDSGLDFDTCAIEEVNRLEIHIRAQADGLISLMRRRGKRLVIVTNEVGQGVVPAYRMGSLFRDIAGRVNMRIAQQAGEVYCMISGLPLRLKP
jgi:Adenosyl cobinamide kinase/adenosyl cobinamide phosphate guanylyltransferase